MSDIDANGCRLPDEWYRCGVCGAVVQHAYSYQPATDYAGPPLYRCVPCQEVDRR